MQAKGTKNILIVEDEDLLRQALREKFMQENFEVFEARNGRVGLEVAREKHPDVMLVDILMPEMDGLAMMQELRKDSWGEHVPVIILTNSTADSNEFMASVARVEPALYLVKSDWTIDEVVQKVKETLADV